MENKTYLVQLTPLGNYYFGSENTFNSTDKAKNGEPSTNYLVRSRMYPQQTTLLGLARYAILLKENALNALPETKSRLIGEKSFQGLEDKAPDSWGKIASISPLFIRKEKSNYIVVGQDFQDYYSDKKDTNELKKLQPVERSKTGADFFALSEKLAYFEDYDAKQNTHLLWRNTTDENDYLKTGDLFTETSQVGITKSFWGKSDNDAFYRQFFYRLAKGFSFAFYLRTSGPVANADKAVIVPAGADQSLFRIELTEQEDTIFTEQAKPEGKTKITLLSDAYCSPEILNDCYLVITNSVDFRYIKTDVNTKRYYNVSAKDSDMQKSAKLNLLERGSVLYSDQPSFITELLQAPAPYRNAGFNYFLTEAIH